MKIFLLSWDMYGLETCLDITEYQHESEELLIETIRTGTPQKSQFNSILNKMLLRARFNGHRHYEIYAISVSDEIDNEQLVSMFEQDANTSAELIRSRGQKIFSDRIPINQQLIR